MTRKLFLGSEIKKSPKNRAFFHILPVPYEKTVSYGRGTAQGPKAIIAASEQLEAWDGSSVPAEWSIYTHRQIECNGRTEDVLTQVSKKTRQVVRNQGLPIVLGGEHTVTYGAVMGVSQALNNEKIGVIQFDAHADLREDYDGSPWSHACVMKRLVDEGMSLMQLGGRAISQEEMATRQRFPEHIFYHDAQEICRRPVHSIDLPASFPQKVYLSIDVDGLDSAIMPATGTPVPGGLLWWQLLDLIEHFCAQRQVVGFDVVELAPIKNFHAYDYLCAELTHRCMGMIQRSPHTVCPERVMREDVDEEFDADEDVDELG